MAGTEEKGRSAARLFYLTKDEVKEGYADLYTPTMRVGQMMLHGPKTWRAIRGVLNSIDSGPLDARLRELAMLQVGYLANCAYQYAHHIKIALRVGVLPMQIHAIAKESRGERSEIGDLERAVLLAAREMTINYILSDSTFAALKGQLTIEQLMDLLHVIGTYNGLVRVWDSLKIEIEEEYLPYLTEYPIQKIS